jgi:hypothetical protein
VPRRLTGVVALLAMLSMASSVLDTCAGWGSSAEARMNCCTAAGHQCDHSSADACCAQGEQRRHAQPEMAAVLAGLAVDVVSRVSTPPELRVWYPDPRSTHAPAEPPDPHLLFSVFLV